MVPCCVEQTCVSYMMLCVRVYLGTKLPGTGTVNVYVRKLVERMEAWSGSYGTRPLGCGLAVAGAERGEAWRGQDKVRLALAGSLLGSCPPARVSCGA